MVGEGIPVRSSRFSALYRYFRLRRGLSVLYTVLSSFKAKFCHILLRKNNQRKQLCKQAMDDYLIYVQWILGSVLSILTMVDSGEVLNPVKTWTKSPSLRITYYGPLST